MNIQPNEYYHIYNQGNNKEAIFIDDADYLQFLKALRQFILPHSKILAYCLMPNHFHFLIYATPEAATIKQSGNVETTVLANGFRLLQSRYAQYFNKKYNRTGSLFRQKAKAKNLFDGSANYLLTAFQYIHQNPIKAGLVRHLTQWQYSSYFDFANQRNGTLCDKDLAKKIIEFSDEEFIAIVSNGFDEEGVKNIFED